MATKKQKREAAERKHEEFMAQTRENGLAAQQADQEDRARKVREQKAQRGKELLAEHEQKKRDRAEAKEADRPRLPSFADLTPQARAAFMAAASTLTADQLSQMRDPNYTACSFALGRGNYCTGDVRFPTTHAIACPHYGEIDVPLTREKI